MPARLFGGWRDPFPRVAPFLSLLLLPLLMLALSSAGCRRGDREKEQPAPPPASPGPQLARVTLRGNLLANPGFEEGKDPWFALESESWVGFQLAEGTAHGGNRSAWLAIRAGEDTPRAQVYGVSQYVNPDRFPTKISGWYLVKKWVKGANHQYMQAVVMVWGRLPERSFSNYQIRYILGGVAEQPYSMANARYVFLRREDPVLGEWTYFEAKPAESFATLWKRTPADYAKLQVFYEARFDDRTDTLAPTEADVFFDDLYFGE